jgi:hypothetical protein
MAYRIRQMLTDLLRRFFPAPVPIPIRVEEKPYRS